MEVVGTAGDPYVAREKIANLHPDVITLDIAMPRMDGLTFLGKLMHFHPLPVIVISSYTKEGTEVALRALEIGALGVLEKPGPGQSVDQFGKTLIETIRGAMHARVPRGGRRAPTPPEPPARAPVQFDPVYKVLAIGASLGGTEAIREVLMGLPANCPGIVIVQHLPAAFTDQYAARLNNDCDLEVRPAKTGDRIEPGVALLAPGDYHMAVYRTGNDYFARVKAGPRVHSHCPSVDVLFHSVASCAGPAATGVLLTGMGSDGARGLLAMRQAGSHTFAQDEASCVVFGMPKVAIDLGAAERVVSLFHMPKEVVATMSSRATTTPAT
jgi:two-component system chemotaxis response regulator CheB